MGLSELLLGVVASFGLLLFGLKLVLEKLTQKNYEFIQYWESLRKESKAPSAEPVSGDRGKRRARGLVHRRLAGDDSVLQMSSASLRESDASFALDDDLAQRRPCFVRLKASQLWLFERSSDSEAICCAALTRNLPIHETADGGITIAFVRGEDRMVPMLAASSFSPKTITLYFVSGGAEWLNALRQLTTSAPNEQPQQHQEQQQQQQPDFTAVMQSPTESPASPFEFETENFTTHRANVPFEKMATIPNSTAEFFNRILWRMFQEMATISVFEEKVGERIVIQLKKKVAKAREMGKWPSVLEEIKYGGMIKGSGFLKVHQVKVDKIDGDGTLLGEVDAEYSGGAGVKLLTRVVLPGLLGRLFGSCPVEIVVRLVRIRAIVYVLMPRNFEEKFSLVFEKFPELDLVKFDVEVLVGARKFPLVSLHETIREFANSLVLRLMCHGLVYPSSMRFFLPYPGRKPQAKIQKYLTRPEAEKYVKQKQRAQSKARAEELELPSGRQIADARKAEQRLRVTQEFFASVFQRDDGGYLHQTADEELEVLGFLDTEPHTTGVGPFLLCVAELKRRLANMTLSLDEESVTEEGVVVQFSLRGTQMAKIWNKFPAQTQGAPVVTGFKVAGAFFFDSFAKMLGIEFFWISM